MRTALFSITTFVLFLALLELLFRLVVYVDKGTKEDRYLVLPHSTLGWSLNTRMQPKRLKNRCGESVHLTPPPHHLLLKSPDPGGKIKLLFVGDSYTHAHEVSTGQAYYDAFEQLEANNYAVYALAVGGYGSLQEYLALESVFERIRPDIVVWQLTGNDVSNNVYELDQESIRHNQRPRPYLQPSSGAISVRNPGFWLFDWSEGFSYLFQKLLVLNSKYDLGLLDRLDWLSRMDADLKTDFQKQGLAVLRHVVGRAVEHHPDTTFIGFSVDAMYDKQYQNIFTENGALYLASFFRELNTGQKTDCRPLDSHWNHLGNRIAGEALSNRIGRVLGNDQQ